MPGRPTAAEQALAAFAELAAVTGDSFDPAVRGGDHR
jgi:hypothetical protein